MKSRTIMILVVSAGLVLVLAMCALTVFGSVRYIREHKIAFGRYETESAEVTQTRTLPAGDLTELLADTRYGNITVTGVEGATEVQLETRIKAWGETQAEAEQAAQALPVKVEQAPGRLTLAYTDEEDQRIIMLGEVHSPQVSFTLRIPAGVHVKLKTGAGEITLRGVTAGADLECQFGAVLVDGLQGGLTVDASSASLTVKNVRAADAAVSLQTRFADILAEDVSAGEMRVEGANGQVTLRRAQAARRITVTNEFTAIELEQLQAADLTVENQNGGIALRGGKIAGVLSLKGGFGAVEVSGVEAGSYRLSNQNGDVRLDGAGGSIEIDSSFGKVAVTNTRQAALQLRLENGDVTFSGSLDPAAAQSVRASFGSVTLTIPPESAFDLRLEATFGKIHSALPVTLSGDLEETRWDGKLNGGGPLLEAQVENGNINIEALK